MVPRVGFESVCPLLCDDEVADASFSLACPTHINAIIVAILRNAFFMSVVRFGLDLRAPDISVWPIFSLCPKICRIKAMARNPRSGRLGKNFDPLFLATTQR